MMTNASPTVHVVDDDASFRTAIGHLLSACGYGIALYDSAKQFMRTLPIGGPACILLDIQMPGLNGLRLQEEIAHLGCRLPVVFITGHGDIPTTVRTIRAGAEDFLTKPVVKKKLLAAIERGLAHYEDMRERDSRIANLRLLHSQLTLREREVFALLARGKPHKQIAYALGTSERTIKAHRHSVMEKCQVHSAAELAVIAERLGLLSTAGGNGNDGLESVVAQPAANPAS